MKILYVAASPIPSQAANSVHVIKMANALANAGHETILVSVKDTGIGIPEEFRSRIWGRFERYDDHALVMDIPGTGLGLSIVKELVQMHNGNICFDTELGKGTTFYVELPIEQPVREEAI